MAGLEDLADRYAARELDKRREGLYQAKQRVGVASIISELTADPRWKIYGDHLQTLQKHHEGLAKTAEDKLLGFALLSPEENARVKIIQIRHKSYAEALALSLQVAKKLIEQGEQAQAEIAKLIAEEQKD